MMELSDYQGVSPISEVQSTGEATGSQDAIRPHSMLHPVSNKPVPSTAIIMKDVIKVTTPGTFSEAENDSSESEVESDSLPPQATNSKSFPAEATVSKRPTSYMTKSKKTQQKREDKSLKMNLYQQAVDAFKRGDFKSMRKCSEFFKVPNSTLRDLVRNGGIYKGSGKHSSCLSFEEETAIVDHVKWRASIGCGVDFRQLQDLIQESLLAIKQANPERITGYENTGQFPNIFFVRRLVKRHNLSLRRTSEISKGRQVLTKDDLKMWQVETEQFLLGDPKLREALMDPRRVFNQDETAVEVGSESQRVLAEINTKILYSISGGSREHITASFLCGADGSMVPPRCIYKGVRNVAQTHLKDLPKNGLSGEWNFSVSDKGYITRELYVEVLKDLDKFLNERNIPRPVIIFIDGANPHISLEAATFCKEKQIQPWLLKPNMTHILQPLDLTFFSSLKKQLKKMVWDWQCTPSNVGSTLNKYSIVALLREATELCLQKPELVANGFKRAGIFPWNPQAPDTTKLLPGTIFQTPSADNNHQIETSYSPVVETSSVGSKPEACPEVMEFSVVETVPDPSDDILPPSFDSVPASDSRTTVDVVSSDISTIPIFESVPYEMEASPEVLNTAFLDITPEVMDSSVLEVTPVTMTPSEPTLEATSQPYWHGNTQLCLKCDRRILKKFFDTHTQSCNAIEIPLDIDSGTKLDSVPQFSLDDRITQLNKFEVLLLTPIQVKEFNEIFSAKKFDVKEPLFHSWLTLKLAAIPTESEALERVLKAHTVEKVPKRKQKRSQNLPTGAARYDPTSPEWVSVLQEQENRKKNPSKKQQKEANKDKPGKQGSKVSAQRSSMVKTAKKKLRV